MDVQKIQKALAHLRAGKMVLVHDSERREGETDFVVASQFVTPSIIRTMRRDGGGLICVTVHPKVRTNLGLPFLTEVFENLTSKYPVLGKLVPNDIPYDTKSAFGITINYRGTFTGITDIDRAITIKEFAKLCEKALYYENGFAIQQFGKYFRAPGHVTLLNAADNLLKTRRGHTELATALMELAGLIPSATICELMHSSGKALPKHLAQKYAVTKKLVFLEGYEVVDAWLDGKSDGNGRV
jgi:3,4-dihydroxy 2-butanone 4-phosphate synthase